jgi:hypothetical protein
MFTFLVAMLVYVRAFLMAWHSLAMEQAALRQQLAVYKRKHPRPKLNRCDRLFWVVVRRIWNNWSEALILVKPGRVISWHRAGYRLFWRWRSRPRRVGRPKMAEEVQQLIRQMKRENPSWGAPRIHGELLLLGFDISEPTLLRYLRRLKRMPDERKASEWLVFLNNHREAMPHSTSSPFPIFISAPCTASSLSNMPAGASCTSTLRSIQQAIGSYNNYAKHSRCQGLIDTSCSTMTPNSGTKCSSS